MNKSTKLRCFYKIESHEHNKYFSFNKLFILQYAVYILIPSLIPFWHVPTLIHNREIKNQTGLQPCNVNCTLGGCGEGTFFNIFLNLDVHVVIENFLCMRICI